MSSTAQLTRPLSLESNPFSASAAVPYVGRPLETAFQEILRQIDRRTPTILVTGGASTGKTLLVDMMARACNEKGLSVRRVIRGDLLHMMLDQRSDVLLVDEANSVAESVLDAISPEGGRNPATTAIFMGLPATVSRFLLAKVHPFMIELTPLPEEDAQNYLLEQARRAGLHDVFAAGALDIIVAGSQGSPRLLRSNANMAYFGAFSEGASQIGRKHAESAMVGQISFGAPSIGLAGLSAEVRKHAAETPANKLRESALVVRYAGKLSAGLQPPAEAPAEPARTNASTEAIVEGTSADTEIEQPVGIAIAEINEIGPVAEDHGHEEGDAPIAVDMESTLESPAAVIVQEFATVEEQPAIHLAPTTEPILESAEALARGDAQSEDEQPAEITANADITSEGEHTRAVDDAAYFDAQIEDQQPVEIAATADMTSEDARTLAPYDTPIEDAHPAEIAALAHEEAQPAAGHASEIAPPEGTDGFAWAEATVARDGLASVPANDETLPEGDRVVAAVKTSAVVESAAPALLSAEPLLKVVVSNAAVDMPARAANDTKGFGASVAPSLARHRRPASARRRRTHSWMKAGAIAAALLMVVGAAAAIVIVEPSMLSRALALLPTQSGSANSTQSVSIPISVSAQPEPTPALRPAIPVEAQNLTPDVPAPNGTEKSANVPAAIPVPNVTGVSSPVPSEDVVNKTVTAATPPRPARRALTPEEQAAVDRGIRALQGATSQTAPLSTRR